jgi:hypothetical protein
MKIVGSDGSAKYLLTDNKIIDLHKHVCEKLTDSEDHVCSICGEKYIESYKETTDVISTK